MIVGSILAGFTGVPENKIDTILNKFVSEGNKGPGQTPYFTWAELNYSLGRPKLLSSPVESNAELNWVMKINRLRLTYTLIYINMTMHLVRLMWRSTFDPNSIFSRCSRLAGREERLSRSKWIQSNLIESNAVLWLHPEVSPKQKSVSKVTIYWS